MANQQTFEDYSFSFLAKNYKFCTFGKVFQEKRLVFQFFSLHLQRNLKLQVYGTQTTHG